MEMKQFNWNAQVSRLSAGQISQLATERGYREEILSWLSLNNFIGWSSYNGGRWCFPVHAGGAIVSSHQIPLSKGTPITYFPPGKGTFPLVVGDPATASMVMVFESQWDMIAALDAASYHKTQRHVYIATRGAANRLPLDLPIPTGKKLFAVMQNDSLKNGKVPAEEWLKGICNQEKWPVVRVDLPAPFEDPQACLLESGLQSFGAMLRDAMQNAKPVEILHHFPSSKPLILQRACADKPDILKNPVTDGGISGKSGLSDEDEWESSPFPAHLLPATAQRLVSGFMAMTDGHMPVALPGVCCLGMLSSSIGPYARIRSTASGDSTTANLYLLAAAESSSGKSLAFSRITKPFFSFEAELREALKVEKLPRLKSEKELLTAERVKLIKKGGDKDMVIGDLAEIESRLAEIEMEMEPPRLFVADTSSQAIIRLMAKQGGSCLSSLSDDAREILDIIGGKFNRGKGTDDSFFIQSWTGGPYAYDRVTDKENIVIKSPWLSSLWFVQPDKLKGLTENAEMFHSGFFQRLLVCDTGATPLKFSDRANSFSESITSEWADLIESLLTEYRRKEDGGSFLIEPSPEAETLLRSYQNECVDVQIDDYSDIPTVAGKWGENAWRIALILHLADDPENAPSRELDRETAERAVEMVRWFSCEAIRLLTPAREEKQTGRAGRLSDVLRNPQYADQKLEGVSQGRLKNSHGFERKELESLCEKFPAMFERIEKATTAKGGKPTFFVRLNPA